MFNPVTRLNTFQDFPTDQDENLLQKHIEQQSSYLSN